MFDIFNGFICIYFVFRLFVGPMFRLWSGMSLAVRQCEPTSTLTRSVFETQSLLSSRFGQGERTMGAVFTLVLLASIIAMVVSVIWYVIETFSESFLWGLGYLFLPFVGLLFAIFHWDRARNPFLLWIVGLIGYVVSIMVVG